MAEKKKSGRGVGLVVLFILFSVLDDMPGMNSTALIIIFRVGIIAYALKGVLFGPKGIVKGGIRDFTQQIQNIAIEKTEQYIQTHPNDPQVNEIKEQIAALKKGTATKLLPQATSQHNLSGTQQTVFANTQASENYIGSNAINNSKNTTTKEKRSIQQHSLSGDTTTYTNNLSQQNYSGKGNLAKDALGNTSKNPYSLDGK